MVKVVGKKLGRTICYLAFLAAMVFAAAGMPSRVMATSDALERPEVFDLRDVNGFSYISPLNRQGSLGLCWAFATLEQAESLLMLENEKPYDEAAVRFSVRQMDYATSRNGISGYDNEYATNRNLGGGGNFYMASFVMAEGVSMVAEENMPYDTDTDGKKLAEVLSFVGSLYEVENTAVIPPMMDKELFVNTIKDMVMTYGGAYVGTGSPIGACGVKNADGTYVIDEESDCEGSANYSGHGMQVIGWNDNYEYSYCKSGSDHVGANQCDVPVTGRGAWILRNSWGDDASLAYVYLSYDSVDADFAFVTKVAAMKNRNWDNNYHHNPFEEPAYARTEVAEFTKKLPGGEELTKIKFMTMNYGGVYNIKVQADGKEYNIGAVETEMPGIYTVDVTGREIKINSDDFTVIVEGDGSSYLLDDAVMAFTKNTDATPVIKMADVDLGAEATEFDEMVYFETKNVPSGEAMELSLMRNGVDATELLNVEDNVVAVNNALVKVKIGGDLAYGGYILTASYGGKSYQTSIQYGEAMHGDVNGDGKVSSADYVKIRKHIMGTETVSMRVYYDAADVNNDEKISSADYIKIRKYIMNGGEL